MGSSMSTSVATVDERGRIVIPSKIRKKLNLRKGDALVIIELGNEALLIKKLDTERMLREIAERVSKAGLDFEAIKSKIEREANKIAEKKIHGRY